MSKQRFRPLEVGEQFSRGKDGDPVVTVIRQVTPETYFCQCSCGNQKEIKGHLLRHHHVFSCGCLRRLNGIEMGKLRQQQDPDAVWKMLACRSLHPVTKQSLASGEMSIDKIKALRSEGKSLREISSQFGVSYEHIRKILKSAEPNDFTKQLLASGEMSVDKIKALRGEGKSVREISSHFGVSPYYVRKMLKSTESNYTVVLPNPCI